VSDEDPIVTIRRAWSDQLCATVRLSSLTGLRWDISSGGVRAPTPQPFVHGYVWCDSLLDGELSHSCQHGPPPHPIKVCVVKKDNDPAVFRQILTIVGPKPKWPKERRGHR
jgi:hypothetical protein